MTPLVRRTPLESRQREASAILSRTELAITSMRTADMNGQRALGRLDQPLTRYEQFVRRAARYRRYIHRAHARVFQLVCEEA